MPQNRNSKIGQGAATPVAERGFVPAANQPHTARATLSAVVTLNIPQGVSYIMMQALAQNICYTLDGSTPSTDNGFRLVVGNEPTVLPVVNGRTMLRFIEAAGGAVLQYQYGE